MILCFQLFGEVMKVSIPVPMIIKAIGARESLYLKRFGSSPPSSMAEVLKARM
jgi:hypothetical protein